MKKALREQRSAATTNPEQLQTQYRDLITRLGANLSQGGLLEKEIQAAIEAGKMTDVLKRIKKITEIN